MMWTLNKNGTFEQNLERVAQAGYNQVELVAEFKGWSPSDMARILARMAALGVTIDAMAGMTLGFADPAGGDAFLAELKTLIPVAHQLACKQIILLSGKRIATLAADDNPAQHTASIETRTVSARTIFFNASIFTRQSEIGNASIATPSSASNFTFSTIEACALGRYKTCIFFLPAACNARTCPRIARAFASVAPLVKIISSDCTSTRCAISLRASSTIFLACRPSSCGEDGLPEAPAARSR